MQDCVFFGVSWLRSAELLLLGAGLDIIEHNMMVCSTRLYIYTYIYVIFVQLVYTGKHLVYILCYVRQKDSEYLIFSVNW